MSAAPQPLRQEPAAALAAAGIWASGQLGAPSPRGTGGLRHAGPSGQLVAHAVLEGFVHGLNEILWIGAVVAFVAAGLCFILIRQKDFTAAHTGEATGQSPAGEREHELSGA